MTPNRKVRGAAIFALLGAALLATACGPGDSDRRVVLITIDSLRPDRLATFGAKTSLAPHLDEFAGRASAFTHASTPCPMTFPALAGLMTGRPPSQVGVLDDQGSLLSTRHPRLAPAMLAGGWATGAFLNHPEMDETSGLVEGFRRVFNPAVTEGARTPTAAVLFADALRFLDNHRHVPAFAWIHIHDSHFPYLGDGVVGHGEARYDAAIAAADRATGAFLEELQSRGLADDALIIVAADHGEGLGSDGEATHGLFLNAATVDVPLLVRLPGQSQARHLETPVTLLDLAPTLLEYAGLPPLDLSGPLDGRSLLPLLRGDGDAAISVRQIYAETFAPLFNYGWPPLRQRRDGSAGSDLPPLPQGLAVPAAPDAAARRAAMAATANIVGLVGAGRFDEAKKEAMQLVAQQPASSVAGRLLASAHRASGDLDGAVGVLQDQAGGAGSADLWAALATLLQEMGRPSSAAWEKAASISPQRPRFRIEHARALLQEGDTVAALQAARAAVAADVDSAVLNAELGEVLLLAGQPHDAQQMLATAAVQAPGSSLTYRRLARAFMAADDRVAALEALDIARKIDPAEPAIHQERGDLLAARGDLEMARAAYVEALPAGTSEPAASLAVAEGLARSGRFDAAASIFSEVLEGHGDNAQAHYGQAQAALQQGKAKAAEKGFLAALRSGGERAIIYYGLARAALMQADEKKAMNYLDKVFAADEPSIRRAMRTDRILAAPERSPELRLAVQRYLTGAASGEEIGAE